MTRFRPQTPETHQESPGTLFAADSHPPRGDPGCLECASLRAFGRTGKNIHCRRCHQTWTGNEAQHCVRCCHTFVGIDAADAHRFHKDGPGRFRDECDDPATTPGWREKRPGVWTNSAEMTDETKARMRT